MPATSTPSSFSKLGINVLLLDPVPEESLRIFSNLNYNVTKAFEHMTESQLLKKIRDYQVVCLSRESTEILLTDEVIRST
jgi:hypothetical protein